MSKIALIACVGQKLPQPAPARDLYVSPLFTKSVDWFILSALYGLVHHSVTIDPYNKTLHKMTVRQRKRWSSYVWSDLRLNLTGGDHVVILAGLKYREFLIPQIERLGCRVRVPMKGLVIGQQLQWLSKENKSCV